MALIDCIECNKQISDQAMSCPHCGIPRSKIITNVNNSVEIVNKGLSKSKRMFNIGFWFSSKGRISRSQYIIGFIIISAIFLLYNILIDTISESMLNNCDYYYYNECLGKIIKFNLISKLPILIIYFYIFTILCIKRFHDICKSGYQTFLLLIPIVGFYYLWILLSEKGNDYENMYDNH